MERIGSLLCFLVLVVTSSAQSDTATVRILRKGCYTRLTLEQLRTLPVQEATLTERDGSQATYQGVSLGEVLDLGCDSTALLDKHGSLRAVVKVTAADGFVAVVAMAEALKDFSDHPVMLAWQRNGEPLNERHGPFQLVLADDRKPGRNVRQVKVLEVIQP
ncbi:MAG: molybdopterin-dependent oxidoreductase [Flavobacteriales bacterium]|nr:molybdopterin-dependent oxidoreductase [Flavobacteriales bacterium]